MTFTLRDDEADARMSELHEQYMTRWLARAVRNDEADERMGHLHRRFRIRRTVVDISSITSKRVPQIDELRGETLERVAGYLGCDPHIAAVLADRIAREWRRAGHAPAELKPTAGVPVIPPTGAFTYAP